MKKNSLLKIAIATFLLVGIGFIPHDSTASNSDAAPQHIAIDAAYGRLPLAFEANDGQVAPQVKFLSRGRGYSLFLTDTEAVLTLKKSRPVAADTEAGAAKRRARQRRTVETSVLRMTMLGANTEPKIAGADKLPGVVNYYRGTDPAKWRTGVATYEKVRLEKVYPGIDLVYYGNQRQLEYDYIVAPGANPKRIRLGFEGAQKISVDKGGDLVVETGGGEVRWHKPVVYQQVRGERKPVAGKYVLRNEKEISFQIARYDATKPLVIDPSLAYSTYLGGSDSDNGNGIAVDDAGEAWVTGDTSSTDFPIAGGGSPPDENGAFVTKLNASGTALLFSTVFSRGSGGRAIALDSTGNAYITGIADPGFATTAGSFQPDPALDGQGNEHGGAFVAKLDASGTLLYATYLGGSGPGGATPGVVDYGDCIAADDNGNAYIGGLALSPDFPTTVGAFQTTLRGGPSGAATDGFVTKLNASGSALIYSTFLGGSDTDYCSAIAVDSLGNAYVTGATKSADFPIFPPNDGNSLTPDAFQTSYGGGDAIGDAFVTKLNSTGTVLLYSTYLGGSGDDRGNAIAVDSLGNAYVAGDTGGGFPTTVGAFQTTFGGGGFGSGNEFGDGFVTKVNTDGTGLVYSTYLGGGDVDICFGLALGDGNSAYVTGQTSSTDFPINAAIQASLGASQQSVFVTKVNADGSALTYSTYLGGGDDTDRGIGIAADATGNAYVTGEVDSTDFPTTPSAFQTTIGGGGRDAFITKIAAESTPLPDLKVTNITTTNERGKPLGKRITITATIANTGNAAAGPSHTSFMDGTFTIGSVATPAIPVGSSVDVSIDWKPKSLQKKSNGSHTIVVTADANNEVAESDETNNTAQKTVTTRGNQVTG